MAQQEEKLLLAFDIEVQTKRAARGLSSFSRDLAKIAALPKKFERAERKSLTSFTEGLVKSRKSLMALQKSLALAGKETGEFGEQAQKQAKETADAFKNTMKASDNLRKASVRHAKEISKIERQLADATDKDEKAYHKDALARAQERAKKEINLRRSTYSKMTGQLNKSMKGSGAADTVEKHSKQLSEARKAQDEIVKTGKSLQDAATDAVSTMKHGFYEVSIDFSTELLGGVKDSLDSLGSKDFAGVAKGLAKSVFGSLKAGGGSIGKWAESNKDAGGMKGKLAGGMAKEFGMISKSVGPMIQQLMKLGPILSLSAGILAGMFKVLVDIESQAKGFNKDILESAGSAAMLYKNGGDASKTFKDMDQTLDSLRSSAYNVGENMKWGINADVHKGLINTFTQEGVSLNTLRDSFKTAGDAANAALPQVQSFGDLTHMAVAYSRTLGVSVAEIGTMQAEMFTELGGGLGQIQLQFARMARDSAESGIAANKFFNIIRGVSSDLALYNTRLEQTTTILKLLGKAMSPKNAAKFLQSMSKGMKDMSEEDRIKQTLIAGEGKQREIVMKDLKQKEALLYSDIAKQGGTTLEEVQKAAVLSAKDGGKAMNEILAKVPAEARGQYAEAMSEIKMDKNAVDKGGVVGLAEASSNLSMAGAFDAKVAALQRFGGKKKLSDMTGIEGFAARKATNTSLEEFRSMAKMEAAIDSQKKTMEDAMVAVKNGGGSEEDKKMVERMEALGIKDKGSLDKASNSDVIRAMTRSDQEALADSQEQVNWAEKQASLTSGLADKMDVIISGIFEYLYVALKDVITLVNDLLTIIANSAMFKAAAGSEGERVAISKEIASRKNGKNDKVLDDLNRAIRDTSKGGDVRSRTKGAVANNLGKVLQQSMADTKEIFETQALNEATLKKNEGNKGATIKLTAKEEEEARKRGREKYESGSASAKLGTRGEATLQNILKSGFQQEGTGERKGMSGGQAANIADMMTELGGEKQAKFKAALEANGSRRLEEGSEGPGKKGAGGKQVWDDTKVDPQAILKAMEEAGFTADDRAGFAGKSLETMSQADMMNLAASGALDSGNPVKDLPTGKTPLAAPTPSAGSPAAAAAGGTVTPGGTPVASAKAPPQPEAAAKQNETIIKTNEEIHGALRDRGIKLDKGFLAGDFEKSMKNAVLDAARIALYEFAMYTASDPKALIDKMTKSGFAAGDMASSYLADPKNKEFLGANSTGGEVTGIRNGMAVVAAPGEGLASIGPGETILPAKKAASAGGSSRGGDTFQISVNGMGGSDLANYLQGKVAEIVYEYKRKEKFRLCLTFAPRTRTSTG